jgi:hypothetical protein
MSKDNFYRVVKTIFLLAAVIGGIVFAYVRAFGFQRNGAIWAVSQYTVIAWLVCAMILFLTVIFFLRITRVSWFWSIISGVFIIVIYSVLMTLLFDLLEGLIRGWLFG